MTNKIIIELLNDEGKLETKTFESLTALNKAYPQYAYHQLRQIYQITNNVISCDKLKKNGILYQKMKIYDECNYVFHLESNVIDKIDDIFLMIDEIDKIDEIDVIDENNNEEDFIKEYLMNKKWQTNKFVKNMYEQAIEKVYIKHSNK